MDLRVIKKKALGAVHQADTLQELEEIFRLYLGSKGEISLLFGGLKNAAPRKRAAVGKKLNELKEAVAGALEERRGVLKEIFEKKQREKEWVDISLPGKKIRKGTLHPLTRVMREIRNIFSSMGFEIAAGPEIETEYYNFDALNIPVNHPARDLTDTFWLHGGVEKNPQGLKPRRGAYLLRTHTSPVQIHYMEIHEPPFRIIVPGRAFRREATDASHEFEFLQLEGLMVGGGISLAHLRGVLEEFFARFFRKRIETRFRPSYFPFVEPGVEVDMSCLACDRKGCSVCSRTGWLEMMGAGMVHPEVFKAVGYNPKSVQGFAFGMGIDRLAMMKYKIDDVRLFRNGDLRFLKQF